MSHRSYVITLSLTGAAVAAAFWLMPENNAPSPQVNSGVRSAAAHDLRPRPPGRFAESADTAHPAASAPGARRPMAAASNPLPAAADGENLPLEERAARVEQEANRELSRLVTLLNLTEDQQDKVFETLAKHSRYWSPEMQFGTTGAEASGKRSPGAPGLSITDADTPAKTAPLDPPAAVESPVPAIPDTAKATDPLEEIMSVLDPEQQTTLVKDEMDRAAWWAEILPQILPTDDIPALDGALPPAAGETRDYEGSEVLE